MSFEPNPIIAGVTPSNVKQNLIVCNESCTEGSAGLAMRAVPQTTWRCSFSDTLANPGVESTKFNIICQGAGQTISQDTGNLRIVTGTAINEETIIRSTNWWSDSLILRVNVILSQRIAAQSFYIELVDVLGDNLAVTGSGTALTIAIPGHTLTSTSVGQSVFIGAFKNIAGGGVPVPGQWAIASVVDGVSITVTATGSTGTISSGTCSVWGYNSIRTLYDSTTATNAKINATRNGWNSAGDSTVTVNTTTTGHIGIWLVDDGICNYADSAINSGSSPAARGTRTTGVPSTDKNFYLQIRTVNGTTNPATTTTFTIGMVAIEDFSAMPVTIQSSRGAIGSNNAMPVVFPSTPTVTASSTAGVAAHDSAVSGNPVRTAGRALTANYTTVASGDTADLVTTLVGALITKLYALPELEYNGLGSISNSTTAVQIKAATASNKNYVTGLHISTDALTPAGEIQLRDTPIASTTATISTNTLVMSATYGWKVGDLVYVTASTVSGLTAGNYYYILTVSTVNLTFSTTRGGGTLSISGTSVAATLAHVIWKTTLKTASLPLTQIRFLNPVSTGTGLALEMCTPVAITGGVEFGVQGYVAP